MQSRLARTNASQRSDRRSSLLFALTVLALAGCGALLWPFLPALTGAGIVALLTRSLLQKLRKRIRNRSLVATVGVLSVALCILAPATIAAVAIGQRLRSFAVWAQDPSRIQHLTGLLSSVRRKFDTLPFPSHQFDIAQTLNNIIGFLTSTFLSFLSGSASALTQMIVMLFLLFFWFRDEDAFRRKVAVLLPLARSEQRFLFGRVRSAVRASVSGRLVVSATQGLCAWVVFLALGIPGAPLLANLTSLCALIPAFGAALVWVPVVFYLLLIHAWLKAIVLLVLGTFVLSLIDNVLFPIIVGASAHMETAQMFLSVFGGVWLFGICGLVLGPLLWVVAEALLAIWRRRERRHRLISSALTSQR